MFSSREIAEYYNTTQIHYEQWWQLAKGLSLHYGIWEKGIKTFAQSLENTNKTLMDIAAVSSGERVLDVGCGVGGAAIYLANKTKSRITGITLSEKQLAYAQRMAKANNLTNFVDFQLMDYTDTTFQDESFDVVWACESVSSAPEKTIFMNEAFRLLKKGGRLILSDFFIVNENQEDKKDLIKKWIDTWSVSKLDTCQGFTEDLKQTGFRKIETYDYTAQIYKSAKRMYTASLLGAIPSELYNLTHPGVTRFAKTHYKCGYYQYKALKGGLWKYFIVRAEK